MLNTTTSLLVNASGDKLRKSVKRALLHASRTLLRSYGMDGLDLTLVTSKTHLGFAFCKFVELNLLVEKTVFDHAYLENAFACSQHDDTIPPDMFQRFFPASGSEGLGYTKTYAQKVKRGIGLFLVSLHTEGTITLPSTFRWPTSRTSSESGIAGNAICVHSELLSFVRSVETVRSNSQNQEFSALRNAKRAEWFLTYGTKALLATGWNKPEEVNYFDLFEVFKAQDESRGEISNVSVYKEFAEIIGRKFRGRVPEGFGVPGAWDGLLDAHRAQQVFEKNSVGVLSLHSGNPVDGEHVGANLSSEEAFNKLLSSHAGSGNTVKLREYVLSLSEPNLLSRSLEKWLDLQRIYMKNVKRESYKTMESAFGHFNLYLYVYVVAWFKENPSSGLKFPVNPDLLVGTAFISRLVESNALPRTFMDYMNTRSIQAEWDGNSFYGTLKQLELFFSYIERNAHKLENCTKFVQPLTSEDFPPSASKGRSNKIPVKRRHLGFFIAYAHAVKDYIDSITMNIVDGHVSIERIQEFRHSTRGDIVIDCSANQDVARLPMASINGKLIALDYIPSVLRFDWKRHIDGRYLLIPHPHTVNQIIVALYSGIRHNHIQWLDAEKFDRFVTDDVFPELFVNTDKKMKKPWRPRVNAEVISVLRDQLAWRKMIDEPRFAERHFYNDNKDTSYPKFLPLFASSNSGLPHPDSAYASTWIKLLTGFQGFLLNVVDPATEKMPVLIKLRPAGVDFYDIDPKWKFNTYATSTEALVPLRIVSEITPHSARVGVVSDLIHYLPADMIGSKVTGQTERVVRYYVHADAEEIADQALYQGMDLRRRALLGEFEGSVNGGARVSSMNIKADAVNSSLAKSMRRDVQETIARYGCISLVNSDGESGIDYLTERGIDQAAFNDTEICPFGNNCPPELIKLLKGFRRCSICPYAVRSIDHLPAICAKKKCKAEDLVALDRRMEAGEKNGSLSADAMDVLEDERMRLAEEIAGWELCEEVLEQARQRIENGSDTRRWVVEKPEILLQRFERVELDGTEPHYLLARLLECNSYPGFQSPLIALKFDALRRRILANASTSLDEVLSLDVPSDPAAECMGVIRSLVASRKLSTDDVVSILSSETHLLTVPRRNVLRIAHE